MPDYPRRAFLQRLAFFGGGVVLLGGCKREANSSDGSPPPSDGQAGGVLTPLQHATMAAACERILPRDEDAGALDANVPEYIERQLRVPEMQTVKDVFIGGLNLIERRSRALAKKSFAEAAPARQDELLSDFRLSPPESGEARFYEFLVLLTLEGFLGDPSYGGNKDHVGWKLVGFGAGPPLPGQSGSHSHHGG